MEENHIIMAYEFDGKGGGKPIAKKNLSAKVKSKTLTWVHLKADELKTKTWVKNELKYLDPVAVEALLADETRPRVEEFDNGLLIILRGVNFNKNAAPEDMVAIRLWIDENRIISLRRRKIRAITDIEKKINDKKAPKNSGDFLTMLISRLLERMGPIMGELDEKLDNAEEKLLETADSALRSEIVTIRRQAIMFRRYMAPQREAVSRLRTIETKILDMNHKRRLQENFDRVTRYVEDLDTIRERAQIVKDELANAIADKLNHNMYILSVIAAIFLPLGFLTGLLGINVGGIPGAEDSNAFFIFCAGLATIVALQVLIFKKLKWF